MQPPREDTPWLYRALRRVVEVERAELAPLLWAFSGYTLLLCGYYMVRPVREAFGVSGGLGRLPLMMVATVSVSLLVNPLYASLVARLPRSRVLPLVYRGVIACFLAFFLALQLTDPTRTLWVGRLFYVFLSVANLFLVSVFFSLAADLFTRERAARLFGCITAGGSLGGLLGGTLTHELVDELGAGGLLLVSCVFLEASLRCTRGLSRSLLAVESAAREEPRPDVALGGSRWAAFRAVARSPFLLGIGGFVLLYGVSGTLAYMFQAAVVDEAAAGDQAAATRIFANLDRYTNAAALFFQVVVAGRLLKRFGAGPALMILPLYSAVGFALLASDLVPEGSMLLAFGLFQVLRRALGYGLKKPAQEYLFTILSPEDKYKAKNLVDLVGPRTGDMLGALTSWRLGALGYGVVGLAATAVPVSLAWLLLGALLGTGFRRRAREQSKTGDPSRAGDHSKVNA